MAAAVPRRSDGNAAPVILVHGYNPTSCTSPWGNYRAQWGASVPHTVTVAYYSGDTNCDARIYSGNVDTPILTLGQALAT